MSNLVKLLVFEPTAQVLDKSHMRIEAKADRLAQRLRELGVNPDNL